MLLFSEEICFVRTRKVLVNLLVDHEVTLTDMNMHTNTNTHEAGGRWQMAGGRWQMAGGRWQVAGGRWQVAGGSQILT